MQGKQQAMERLTKRASKLCNNHQNQSQNHNLHQLLSIGLFV
jgi:hypothetical protein